MPSSTPILTPFRLALLALCLPACSTLHNAPKTIVTERAAPTVIPAQTSAQFVRYQTPEFLTFKELHSLLKNPEPSGRLAKKIDTLFTTPIIDNRAHFSGKHPRIASNAHLGPFLRFASWNIEKSLHTREAVRALTSEEAYTLMIDPEKVAPGSATEQTMLRQRQRLANTDILILQEMDIGVSRSGYINAAETIAQALGMNYTYATQQLEIDPVLLGLEPTQRANASRHADVSPNRNSPNGKATTLRPDPARYKGCFGLAILSRYPIKSATCFQLKTQPYDWYHTEKKKTSLTEDARRLGARIAVKNEITREIKIGGRIFFRADLHVPGLPKDTLTIIHNHLEIKARPRDRDAQIQEILSSISGIRNPLIMAGDHNTAPVDVSATSLKRITLRTLLNHSTWFDLLVSSVGGPYAMLNEGRGGINFAKNFHSPLAPDIPVIFPNKVRPLFDSIEKFRFTDGSAFDFRGDRDRSINGRAAKLANSNQKALKGQTASFSVKRPIGPIGIYRLDWIFVKSHLRENNPRKAPYRLSPHFGETMVTFNKRLKTPISDHHPIVVDLPLTEPPL